MFQRINIRKKGLIVVDKLDRDLLGRVEKALNIKLYEWQINYILDIPMVLDMRITGRGTGKTLAYIIKLLFADDYPIKSYDMSDIYGIADNYHDDTSLYPSFDNHYTRWFKGYLTDIYKCLTSAGIKTRPIFYSKQEYDEFKAKQSLKTALNSKYGLMGTDRKL